MEKIRITHQDTTLRPYTEPGSYTETELIPYKQLFMRIAAKETGGRFIVDDKNKEIVSRLFFYFLKLPGELDNNKGLWLEGPVGTGKSSLMQVFSAYLRYLKIGFKVFISSDVTSRYSIDGNLDLFLGNKSGVLPGPAEMCFDELGREPIPASFYGTKMNVMQHILHVRYNYWQTNGIRTFVTTNADARQIEKLYGEYIRDRRKEMFNIIVLDGNSRR